MSSLGVVRELGEFFLWVGVVGAAIAVLCAVVVLIALARGAAGAAGGAGAVWIGGGLLSLASGFSGQWMPALAAAGAMVAALVLGGVARSAVKAFARRPRPELVDAPAAATPATGTATPATGTASTPIVKTPRIAGIRTVASESIR